MRATTIQRTRNAPAETAGRRPAPFARPPAQGAHRPTKSVTPDADVQRLLRRVVEQDDRAAFGRLVELHQRMIYNLAYRFTGNTNDAEDIAQETFVQAYYHLARFEGRSSFATWLYRICVNTSLNHVKKRQPVPMGEEIPDEPGEVPSPAGRVEQKEFEEALHRAILALPVKYRLVTLLHHLNGLSYDEVAEAMSIPLGTVKANLFRVKDLLRKKLKAWMPTEE